MIPEAGGAAAVQALVEDRRGHDVPQAALEQVRLSVRTQPNSIPLSFRDL